MSLTIPKKYLKAKEDKKFCPSYIIAAPENVQELKGYVMRIMQNYTTVTDSNLIFHQGNEWNKKNRQYFYMFEKEIKIPGHPSKRYRYSEEELIKLYGNAVSPTFEERLKKRKQIFEKGPGRLLRISYTDFSIRNGKESKEGWFISPDADLKWIYPFDYDPLRDQGKHNRDAKGFSILEEYPISDIAILHKHKNHLTNLLRNLNHFRNLQIKGDYQEWIHDRSGNMVKSSSLAESLAFAAYERIPSEIRSESTPSCRYETKNGENLRLELMKISTEMERKCVEAVRKYQDYHIAAITEEINVLIGINIEKK